ncbi:MAG: Rrf2 family transcriptional regulator [Candidatus Uhrbacteria bacterium]|nr:Rrf2 family transcriptional regulator [Candidatus Uhrbacteria bacterium]
MNTTCSTGKKKGARGGPFHLSQKVDYGLFLLSALASDTENMPQSIRSIATNGKLSFSFLQKVAHALKGAGIVRASRGKVGGYQLMRAPGAITVKEIIEALDGKIAMTRCLSGQQRKERCPRQDLCVLRSRLQTMNSEIEEYYMSKKLSDFVSSSI